MTSLTPFPHECLTPSRPAKLGVREGPPRFLRLLHVGSYLDSHFVAVAEKNFFHILDCVGRMLHVSSPKRIEGTPFPSMIFACWPRSAVGCRPTWRGMSLSVHGQRPSVTGLSNKFAKLLGSLFRRQNALVYYDRLTTTAGLDPVGRRPCPGLAISMT